MSTSNNSPSTTVLKPALGHYSGPRPAWVAVSGPGGFVIRLASNRSGLDREQQTATGVMARMGITSCGEWLVTRHGCDLHITADGPTAWSLWQTLQHVISTADVWVNPVQQATTKLLLCDMDSTLIPTESLDELAAAVGIGEQVAAITTRAMNGELDFKQALDQRVSLLKDLDYALVEQCVATTTLNPGALELIAHARGRGVKTVLVSGGFTPFADFVATKLGCDRVVANSLEISENRLTGRVLDPIVTKTTKLDVLQQECADLNIKPEHVCTLGDGANDIDMLQAAGAGVAYRAKQLVLQATPCHLNHAPLDVLIDWLTWS